MSNRFRGESFHFQQAIFFRPPTGSHLVSVSSLKEVGWWEIHCITFWNEPDIAIESANKSRLWYLHYRNQTVEEIKSETSCTQIPHSLSFKYFTVKLKMKLKYNVSNEVVQKRKIKLLLITVAPFMFDRNLGVDYKL